MMADTYASAQHMLADLAAKQVSARANCWICTFGATSLSELRSML